MSEPWRIARRADGLAIQTYDAAGWTTQAVIPDAEAGPLAMTLFGAYLDIVDLPEETPLA